MTQAPQAPKLPTREDCEIYSPEASDVSPYGDWQTKVILGLLVFAGLGCVFLLWKVW